MPLGAGCATVACGKMLCAAAEKSRAVKSKHFVFIVAYYKSKRPKTIYGALMHYNFLLYLPF
jgi:hypothetical protein